MKLLIMGVEASAPPWQALLSWVQFAAPAKKNIFFFKL